MRKIKTKLTFSIDKYNLEQINDDQLMVLELWVVSEGNNSHDMPITRDAILQSASSIIGKPVLYKYSVKSDDFMAHEVDEISCGVLPLTKADYQFKEDEEGKLWLVCKAYVWKMYYPEVADIFIRDEQKAISMEILIVDSETDESNGTQNITAFSFTGVTLLGSTYRPAIANAKATVTKFSDMVKETERLLYADKDTNNEEKEVEQVEIFNKVDFAATYNYTVKEMMNKFEKQCTATYNEVYGSETYECKKYGCRDFCKSYVYLADYEDGTYKAVPYGKDLNMDFGATKECRMTYVVDEQEPEDTEGTEDTSEQMVFTKSEIAEKIEKFNTSNNKVVEDLQVEKETIKAESAKFSGELAIVQEELEELKTANLELANFKANVLQQEKEQNVKFAIDSVSDVLSKDQVKEWSEKANEYENVDSFKNAIQAFAFTQAKQLNKDSKNTVIHIPHVDVEPSKKGLWD